MLHVYHGAGIFTQQGQYFVDDVGTARPKPQSKWNTTIYY